MSRKTLFSTGRTTALAAAAAGAMDAQTTVWQSRKSVEYVRNRVLAVACTQNQRFLHTKTDQASCSGGFLPERCSWPVVPLSAQHKVPRLSLRQLQVKEYSRSNSLRPAYCLWHAHFQAQPMASTMRRFLCSLTLTMNVVCRMDGLLGNSRRLLRCFSPQQQP